jgi:uncharacterized coiled-coil DUF342 family protein
MAFELRNSLFGFNKDDVFSYINMKDHELKTLSAELNAKIEELNRQLEELKAEHLSALSTIGTLTNENGILKDKADEYDRKREDIDNMSRKIGKLYLVSRSTAKTIVDKAEESSVEVTKQTERNLQSIEAAQASLKEVADVILSASENFVSRLDGLQSSLSDIKSRVYKNTDDSSAVSGEFAELYAKLG